MTCEAMCGYEREEGAEFYCFTAGGWEANKCSEENFRVKRSGSSIHKLTTTTTTTTSTTTTTTTTYTTTTSANNPYCDISMDHTMCKYEGPSADCALKTVARSFSESGKNLILTKHNDLRRKVAKGEQKVPPQQPSASNMRKLIWNEELAAIAQRWADQCDFNHDKTGRL